MIDRIRTTLLTVALAAAPLAVVAPAPAVAQGPGSAAAELLRMPAGARASGFAGAYAAMTLDPDALFYNPAATVGLDRSVSLAYQAYVEDVTLGSAAAAVVWGRVVVGGGLVFVDAGRIEEVVPDPDFGGERGRPTGQTVGASEYAARVGVAAPILDGRAALGANLGLFGSDLAGVRRSAGFIDLGGQYRPGERVVVGASLRNLGGRPSDDELGGAPLPLEARLGAAYRHRAGAGFGGQVAADLVVGVAEETVGLALGAEGGLAPGDGDWTAVLRFGINVGEADAHLGRLVFGGGVAYDGLALDYAIQSFEFLGAIHRIGIRWTR